MKLFAQQTVLFVGLLAVVAGWYATDGVPAFEPVCERLACDYVRHFHPAARRVLVGGAPPSGYLYPPTLAVLLRPLASLRKAEAAQLWTALNLLLAWLLAVVPPHLTGRPSRRAALVATGLATLALPLLHGLVWGQVSVLVVLGSLLAVARGGGVGAVVLGALAALKVYPVVWLGLLGLSGRWRQVGVGLVALLGLAVGVPVAVMGVDGFLAFGSGVLAEHARYRPVVWSSGGSQNLAVVLGEASGRASVRQVVFAASWLGFVASTGALRRRLAAHRLLGWAWVACWVPLLVETAWVHYFVHLGPVGWLLWRARPRLAGVLVPSGLLVGWPALIGFGTVGPFAASGVLAWVNLGALVLVAEVLVSRGEEEG